MIEKIARNLDVSGDEPNVALAESLTKRKDAAEIAGHVGDRDRAIAGDCVKVLYEIGYHAPELILPHAELFPECLRSRNNRLVWGACIALARIADRDAASPSPIRRRSASTSC